MAGPFLKFPCDDGIHPDTRERVEGWRRSLVLDEAAGMVEMMFLAATDHRCSIEAKDGAFEKGDKVYPFRLTVQAPDLEKVVIYAGSRSAAFATALAHLFEEESGHV